MVTNCENKVLPELTRYISIAPDFPVFPSYPDAPTTRVLSVNSSELPKAALLIYY